MIWFKNRGRGSGHREISLWECGNADKQFTHARPSPLENCFVPRGRIDCSLAFGSLASLAPLAPLHYACFASLPLTFKKIFFVDRIMVRSSKEYLKKRRNKKNEWLRKFKKETGCQICKYKEHPEILVIHHKELIRRKHSAKSGAFSLSGRDWSIQKIKRELKKCLILCPNCHAWLHYQESQFNFNSS